MLMKPTTDEKIAYLSQFVSQHKQELIAKVLAERTRHLTMVLENIYQPHNISAVIRSCDCFGIQDLNVIEKNNIFKTNQDIAMGASKWISISKHNNPEVDTTTECLEKLKQQGYKIAATSLGEYKTYDLDDLPINEKIAVCIGTEETGLSQTAHDMADYYVKLPMYGFTQSFNLSVTAALCMQVLTKRIRSEVTNWHLSEAEQKQITLEWYLKVISNSDKILERFENDFAK